MIRRIDHVAIAVRDLARARKFFLEGLGGRELYCFAWGEKKFRWTTIELGTSCFIELIDPLDPEGFVGRFLDRHGEGMHHLTIQVDDLEETDRTLRERGIPTFGHGEPFPTWKEMYIHPKEAFGTLIQFAEFDPLAWVNPGYIPAAYREFAAEKGGGFGKETWEVREIETPEGPAVEIRQGENLLRFSKERLGDFIAALKQLEPKP
jgi:methylmalonyl-CoA/ethylmalonyl-CoA epimerase